MVTVVCSHWGVREWPAQAVALAPLAASREIGEVVVVEVESRGELRRIDVPEGLEGTVTFLEIPELVSVTVAFNRGIEAAKGDWVLSLSGDILPVPGSVSAMRAWLEANPGAAMVGGDYWFGEVPELQHATRSVRGILTVQRAGIALNQYGLTRRALWGQVGYDEMGPFARPGWGLEDNDLGCQIRAAGLSIWMVQAVETAAGPAGFRYVHDGLHGSVRKLRKRGIDAESERAARRAYLAAKWSDHPLDGRPWHWEREDNYVGAGRYSLRAAAELRADGGVKLGVPASKWKDYRYEP